jgi:hypothetical protein
MALCKCHVTEIEEEEEEGKNFTTSSFYDFEEEENFTESLLTLILKI